jgi:carbon-monoxide dehydrogenase large subunit
MDGIAEMVGIDPIEARLRNFVKPKQMPYVSVTKKTLDSGDYAAALKRAAELIDLSAVALGKRWTSRMVDRSV